MSIDIPEETLKQWRELYYDLLSAYDKTVEEAKSHYNQKLNLIKDCREFCYTLGEKSLTRLQLQKLLEEFKDDENYVQNRYSEMSKEIEELKAMIKEATPWLMNNKYLPYNEIKSWLEKAEKIKA